MKVKKHYLFIIFCLITLYLFIGGYRFNPKQAADSHASAFLEKGAPVVSEVDVGWGHAYIYKGPDYYLTVMSIKKGFLWRAPASISTKYINDKSDSIKTIGWMSYTNNENESATVLVIENQDEDVAFIEVGKEFERNIKNVSKGEILIFIWDKALFTHDINPVALSKDYKELYKYGYTAGTTQLRDQDLKWHRIK